MRQASLCSCIAAVIAWSLDNVSHQCPGLISCSQAESGAPSHSRKRGWFNGTPRPPSGRAWSSHLYVVCLKAQPFPKTRREACERSFGNGPSRAKRHRGTVLLSLLLVVLDTDRLSILASSLKMSLNRNPPLVSVSQLWCVNWMVCVADADVRNVSDLTL